MSVSETPVFFICRRCSYCAIKELFATRGDSIVCPSCSFQISYCSMNAPKPPTVEAGKEK